MGLNLKALRARADMMAVRVSLVAAGVALPGMAMAQNGPISSMITSICSLIKPLAGNNSQVISLVFLIALGVMIFMWWMSENKEGVITWILRTGIALGVLINLFTLPTMIGLPSVC